VPQPPRQPEAAIEPVSSPVKVIEIGAAEKAGDAGAPDADAGDQSQRRGWWRRLME
jgi:hypothetical protein